MRDEAGPYWPTEVVTIHGLTEAEAATDLQIATSPDPAQIELRAELVSHLLQSHGGGVEVIPSKKENIVRLRFTGLCTACSLRPLTTANIIKPMFGDVPGVIDVEVEGCRISTESAQRLAI